MRCDHRYKLVGYRLESLVLPAAAEDSSAAHDTSPRLHAVLACLKCPREKLVQVDVLPPQPIIDVTGRSASIPEEG